MQFYAKERSGAYDGRVVEIVHVFPSRAKKAAWLRKHIGRNSIDGRLGYFGVTSTEAKRLIERESYSIEEHR